LDGQQNSTLQTTVCTVEKANTLCNSGYFRPFVAMFQVNALAGESVGEWL
jgi:hypothetical protein